MTYGAAAYAIAGYNSGEISAVDRWTEHAGWEAVASYPRASHRMCAVADEGHDKIYGLGGVNNRYAAYEYTVSTDKWSAMSHDSSLYRSFYDGGCAIIHNRNSGNRRIILAGAHSSYTQYFDLTAKGSWKSLGSATSVNSMKLVSLNSYEAYQVSESA